MVRLSADWLKLWSCRDYLLHGDREEHWMKRERRRGLVMRRRIRWLRKMQAKAYDRGDNAFGDWIGYEADKKQRILTAWRRD